MNKSEVPPGWDHNPSAWNCRLPLLGLAGVGFLIAGYLALCQLRVFTAWEPFFGRGSENVLHSWLARSLPIPDAALGALAYLSEMALDALGGQQRWRTAPWLVLLFGLLACFMGVGGVVLAVLQQVLFASWCTLCLASASVSVLLVGPAMGEVLASLQFLHRQVQNGRSWWRALWGLSEGESAGPTGQVSVSAGG